MKGFALLMVILLSACQSADQGVTFKGTVPIAGELIYDLD